MLAAAAVLCAPARAVTYAKGLDVSNWNGLVDWIQVAGDDYTFLFAKATEGTTFTDLTYAVNRAGTQGLGLRLGAYHFARPAGSDDAGISSSAIAQADHFVDVAQPEPGDLPPVLDLETTGGLAPDALVRWTQAWLDEVAARTGTKGVIYASPHFWKTALGDTSVFAANGHGLWIAHWTKNASPTVPAANWAGLGWAFWQWTNCATVPGLARCGDGDRANGPSPVPFALTSFPSGAPGPSTPPTIVGAARAGAPLAGVPGTWNGGKPLSFTYQWLSCDAAGSGCTPVPGATLETYTPTAADVGHALAVSVTATSSAGAATASSTTSLPVAPAGAAAASRAAVLTPPGVSGTAQVGQVLTASAGTWSGSPTSFAYQWRRCDGAGSGCTPIVNAAASSYTLTPGDLGSTLSLVVTATAKGGSQTATAPTTAAVAAAPVPPAVAGSLVAQAGAAGAVATTDRRAVVSWQPGAVPSGVSVSLAAADAAPAITGTGVSLTFTPAQASLPWPVDVAYAAAPAGQVVGFSRDGKIWAPLASLATSALPAGVATGFYTDGSVLHLLTRRAGRIALFRPGRWGDPRRISLRAPVPKRLTPTRAIRQRDGSLLVVTRVLLPSQAHLYVGLVGWPAKQSLLLQPGAIPLRLRVPARRLRSGVTARLRVAAVDPWSRRGTLTLAFRVP